MSEKIIFNLSLKDYQKKYRHNKANLLSYTKNEVKLFDKFNKPYVKDYVLKGRKWALIGDTYYEIPKAPRWTWFRNVNPAAKACTYALVLGALGGGGYGLYSYLKPSSYKDIIVKIDKMNSVLADHKEKFLYPKLAVDYLKDKKQIHIDTLKTGNDDVEYGYNLANNEIVLVGTKDEQVKYSKTKTNKTSDVWRFKDTYTLSTKASDQTYGTFLRKKSSSTKPINSSLNNLDYTIDEQINITFNSNLDVGDNKNCKLVFDSKTVTDIPMVVTNYGDLEVKGSLDNISHYGILNSLTIDSLEGQYNEYGTVAGNVIIKEGTFNAKEDSSINTIIIDSSEVKVNVSKDNEYIGTIGATNKDYITKESVVVPPEKEQKPKIIDEQDTPTPEEGDLQGLGTEASPYMIVDFYTQCAKINENYNKDDSYAYYLYAGSEKEIDCSKWNYDKGKGMNLHGQFDCNGAVLNNLDSYFVNFLGKPGDYDNNKLDKISNLTINATISRPDVCSPVARTAGAYTELENITVHGFIAAGGASSFVCYGANNYDDVARDMHLTFNNCYSDATIYATNTTQGGVSPFFVNSYCKPFTGLTTFKDTIFEGNIVYPDSKASETVITYCRYFNTYAQNCIKVKTEYSDEFLEKYGNPEGDLYPTPDAKDSDGTFYAGSYPGTSGTNFTCRDNFLRTDRLGTLTARNLNEINQAKNDTELANVSTNKVEGAIKATASLYIAPNNKNGNGSYLKEYMSEVIDLTDIAVGGEFSSDTVKNYRVRVNKAGVTEEGVHGYEYDVYDGGKFLFIPETGETLDSREYSGAYISVVQYGSFGQPLCVDRFPLKKPNN